MRVLRWQTFGRAMKVKGTLGCLRWDPSPRGWGHHRPIRILLVKDLSMSIHVGTRKMVNYA